MPVQPNGVPIRVIVDLVEEAEGVGEVPLWRVRPTLGVGLEVPGKELIQ